jgi:histidine triad (HIT) family protein
VPDDQAASLTDLLEDDGAQLFRTAQKVAVLYDSGLGREGVNLFLADGEAAGRQGLHLHLHVIPRFEGDGFGLTFGPDYTVGPTREELKSGGAYPGTLGLDRNPS